MAEEKIDLSEVDTSQLAGGDTILGSIDHVQVPNLDIQTNWLFQDYIADVGTYRGEVKFYRSNSGGVLGSSIGGHFRLWDGSNWAKVSPEVAAAFFRKKDKFIEAEKLRKSYSVFSNKRLPSGSKKAIRFPKDIAEGEASDYVLFDFYEYQPPFKVDKVMTKYDLPKGYGRTKKGSFRLITNETLKQYNQSVSDKSKYNKDTMAYPQIVLYMPDDISTTFGAEWEGKSFGTVATGILQSAAAEGNIEKIKRASGVGANALQKAPAEAAASLITNLAKGITGDQINTGDIFGGIAGVIRNPNTELMFQKMKLRTFNLKFKLVPYNQVEANDIKRICQIFKRAMLPTYSIEGTEVLNQNKDKQSQNRAIEAAFVKIPKVCKVQFMRGDRENDFLPKYKMCAITDVAVNYTPDGNYAVYDDGSPVAVELAISFMETKLVFAEDIDMEDGDILLKWEQRAQDLMADNVAEDKVEENKVE